MEPMLRGMKAHREEEHPAERQLRGAAGGIARESGKLLDQWLPWDCLTTIKIMGGNSYNHHCLPKGFNHPNWGKTIILMVVEA